MPLIEPHLDDAEAPVSPPAPRTALFWDGTHWHVPRVDDHGRVQVRGEDQLFSYSSYLTYHDSGVPSGDDGYRDSTGPVAGTIWKVTSVALSDTTRALTRVVFYRMRGAVAYCFHDNVAAIGIGIHDTWDGELWLEEGDTIRLYAVGSLAADTLTIDIQGHIMTLET